MQKRAFLVHGWGGKPDGGFRPWLKEKLESNGYQVEALTMPDSGTPIIEKWIPCLLKNIPSPDENTLLVGHSLGALALLMFLEKLPESSRVGKVILVAGAISSVTNMSLEEQIIARPWFATPIDYEKIRRAAKSFIAFFSDNDQWVPPENEKMAHEKLNAKTIIEHNMGHYNEDAGVKEVPAVLKEILSD